MAKFRVTLTDEERCVLRNMVSSGKGAARRLLHGRILLQADASPEGLRYTDAAIAEALCVSLSTIHRVRQQFVEESFEAALNPRRPRQRPDKVTITREVEQRLIALACGEPPRGYGRWTVRLLADRLVELGYVARASRATIRQALKKRPQAVAGQNVVHSTQSQCCLRVSHGGRAAGLPIALRPMLSRRLYG